MTGPTLIARHEHAETYDLGGGRRRCVIGGGISNARSFDEDSGLYRPVVYQVVNADKVVAGIYRWRQGRFGYVVDMRKGIIRICPVRGHWNDKYIEISAVNPTQLVFRQISDKALELYRDTPTVRWSFIISDLGFKTNILLKPGYSGNGIFKLGFKVVGLTRKGRRLYDGGSLIGRLPDPYLMDSTTPMPEARDVGETVANDTVTLTADLTGLTFPVVIDPTLSPPADPVRDTFVIAHPAYIHKHFAHDEHIQIMDWYADANPAPHHSHEFLAFDISGVPDGVDMVSALLGLDCYTHDGNGATQTYRVSRCNRRWGEGHGYSVDAATGEIDWTDARHAQLAWSTPGGTGTGDWDDSAGVDLDVAHGYVGWCKWETKDIAQHCLDHEVDGESKVYNIIAKRKIITNPTDIINFYCRSRRYLADPSRRPTLTLDYYVPGLPVEPHTFILDTEPRGFKVDTGRRAMPLDTKSRALPLDTKPRPMKLDNKRRKLRA